MQQFESATGLNSMNAAATEAAKPDVGMFVRERGAALLRFGYQLTRDRSAADDLVQETLRAVWQQLQRRPGEVRELEPYIRRSMINRYLNLKRSPTEFPTDDPGPTFESLDDDAQVTIDRDQLRRVLEVLDPTQRTVLVLRYYLDMADQEIAGQLRCSRSNVRSIAARALRRIRQELNTEDQP